MNLIELEASVDNIRYKIFSYDIANLQSEVLVLAEEIYNQANSLNEQAFGYIKDILNYLMTALSNKDYLVIGDILKYEFLPLITEIANGDKK
jgi:hypothetical protein